VDSLKISKARKNGRVMLGLPGFHSMKVSEELLVTHSHRSSLSGGHSPSMTVPVSSRKKILEEKRKLRACLPEIVAELAALLSKETALARTREARTVNGLVRAFAKELEGQDGLGYNGPSFLDGRTRKSVA
jgi:hypothetical protein